MNVRNGVDILRFYHRRKNPRIPLVLLRALRVQRFHRHDPLTCVYNVDIISICKLFVNYQRHLIKYSPIEYCIEYLTELFDSGLSYETLNTEVLVPVYVLNKMVLVLEAIPWLYVFYLVYIISIFYVFLVWMGKSIPRAKCSIGGDEACLYNVHQIDS